MKEQIKGLRVKVDGVAQLCKELKPFEHKNIPIEQAFSGTGELIRAVYLKTNSKEIEKAVDSLYLGKAWLGKLMGELGNENPYGSGYKTKEDIVPTQDVAFLNVQTEKRETMLFDKEGNSFHYESKSHIEKVDYLRTEIEKLVTEVKQIPIGETTRIVDINGVLPESQKFSAFSREFAIARTNCYTHLCEARFWLGFELERVRNEQ